MIITFCRYCSASKEGLETGSWVCDWCRLENERKTRPATLDMKEATREFSQCTLKSPDNGLEFLIKAVLSTTKEEFPPVTSVATRVTSPTANCGSNCSSSVESEKVSFGVRSASCGLGDASSNLRSPRVVTDTSISDEEGSIGTVQVLHSQPSQPATLEAHLWTSHMSLETMGRCRNCYCWSPSIYEVLANRTHCAC